MDPSESNKEVPQHIKDYFAGERIMLVQELDQTLHTFTKRWTEFEMSFNQRWNAIQALTKAFLNAGLVTEAGIIAAGQELMVEAKKNLEQARLAAQSKLVGLPSYAKTPLEQVDALVKQGQKKANGSEENK